MREFIDLVEKKRKRHSSSHDTGRYGFMGSFARPVYPVPVDLDDAGAVEMEAMVADETHDLDHVEPRTPDTLPTIVNAAAEASGLHLDVVWRKIGLLPKYMQSGIRAFGEKTFARVSHTPVDDIQVVSTLTGSAKDAMAVSGWIRHYGQKDNATDIVGHLSPHHHGANAQLWTAEGFTFMIVVEPHGHFVYGWPTDHAAPVLGGDTATMF